MPRVKSIAQLRRELSATQGRLTALRSRRAKVTRELVKLDRQIASLEGPSAAPGGKQATKAAPKRKARTVKRAKGKAGKRGGRRAGSLVQVIQGVLAKASKPMQAKAVTDAVLAAGYKTKDKSFKATVAQTLAKDAAFARVTRGVYKLAAK